MNPVYIRLAIVLLFSTHANAVCKCVCENEPLLISAFNVRIFGAKKMKNPATVDALITVLSRYDLALVMEIRDSKGKAFPELVAAINSIHDDKFDFVVGKRCGRSSSKEQYGFIYRKDKLEIKSMYEREDEYDVFEREPLVIRFQRLDYEGPLKEFTFIPMHAKPSDAIAEMNSLIDVYEESVRLLGPNAIIAGDLNADCKYVCKSCWDRVNLRSDHRFHWMIPDGADTTTTKTNCAYDRIILAGDEIKENACCASVHRFDLDAGLSGNLTLDVSDHYPVEFTLQ